MKITFEVTSLGELELLQNWLKDRPPVPGIPLNDLYLTARTRNCLLAENFTTIEDVLQAGGLRLLTIPNLGWKSLEELRGRLAERGFTLGDVPEKDPT